jgi:4-amino-4-deoxy-L-arabinose transferase-like glycosyltransferase
MTRLTRAGAALVRRGAGFAVRRRKADCAILAFPLLLSLSVTVAYGMHVVRFGDAGDYLDAARSLITTGTYPRTASLPFFRPPGYPLFIAGLWSFAPDSVVSIKVVQSLLFATTCWLLFCISLLATSDRKAAIAGAALYALNPFALRQAAEVQTETLHTALVATGVWMLLRGCAIWRKRSGSGGSSFGWDLAAGIAFGAAALCRPTALFVGVAMSGFCVFTPDPSNASVVWRRRLPGWRRLSPLARKSSRCSENLRGTFRQSGGV